MSSQDTHQTLDLQTNAEDAVANPHGLESDLPTPPPQRGPRRFIVPLILGLLVLGGLGWVLFNRVILPILMFSQMAPPPPIAVPLGRAKVTTVEESSDYAATLDSRQSVTLQPKVPGQISAIYVRAGDRVQAGDVLLQIDADRQRAQVASRGAGVNTAAAEVETAKADVASARDTLRSLQAKQAAAQANVQLNQADYKRYQALYKAGATSLQSLEQTRNAIQTAQAELNQAKADVRAQISAIARAEAQVVRNQQAVAQARADVSEGRAQLQDYTVTAPFSGVVGNIPAKLGDTVSETTPLLTLTQNQQLEVQIQVPLERASALRQGQPVKLLDDRGKAIRTGQISFIAPNVDSATQSVQAKAIFANAGDTLRTSQFVRARVVWNTRPGLLVPTTAISRLGGKDFIFVAQPFQNSGCKAVAQGEGGGAPTKVDPNQTVAAQKPIRLGKIIGNDQEVLEGLNASDRIVTSGILQLQNCLPIAPEKPVGAG
ncbi:efflux RND transporter periplasmic adaptor subunit [Altericista sp. CCNU0014]|uniref:efflux RND transporter periplasmic adaptor subunit n=1 Tax=Altericista sp. CCNU0014 TaxID=3082949 RepID=UPI0038509333